MDEEQRIIDRFYGKTVFSDGHGLRGPAPEVLPLRQIFGTSGDKGSYQEDRVPHVVDPVNGGGQGGGGLGVIPNVIMVLNGTAYFTNVNGAIVGTV